MAFDPVTASEELRKQIRTLKNRVFTTRDIVRRNPDLPRALVDQVLSRLVRRGELQRIGRGLFTRSRTHAVLGTIPPASDEIAMAVERAVGMPVIPSGALALNALDLS